MSPRIAALTSLVAGLSLLVVPGVPSYDPWAWLLWGRELAHLDLSTAEGPAFKPLPVAAAALLAPLGELAPLAWVALVRVGAVATIALAYSLGRRLAGGSAAAGGAAAACVLLTEGFLGYSASGSSEPVLLAFALGAWLFAWDGRHRAALACVVACALLRVEAWPFAAAYGVWLWRPADGGERALLAGLAVTVPALWIVPELLGSGDPLRSGSRALQPNPGQPALAARPAWASLREAASLPLWPVWIGLAGIAIATLRANTRAAVARATGLALVGGAWIALVAAMAELGFSGEPRYALPGAALLAIAAAAPLGVVARGRWRVGLAEPPRWAPLLALAVVAVAVAAIPRAETLASVRDAQRYQARLASDLRAAIEAVGGRDAVLACGRPYVGDLRGPLLAYALAVEKRRVGFVAQAPGVVFASRRTADSPIEPSPPASFEQVVDNGTWKLMLGMPNRLPPRCDATGPGFSYSSPSLPSSPAAAADQIRARTSMR